MLLLMGFVIGMTAGFRSMAPAAIVAWIAQQRWPGVRESALSFMTAPVTAWVLTVFAVSELIADKLPFIPSRLDPGPLGARVLSGGLCAATICAATHQSLAVGAVVGGIGGAAGSYLGYYVRRALTTKNKLPDLAVALAEDVLTVGLALLIATNV